MMHAVIRNGADALHLIGTVDGYTLEALKEHTSTLARDAGTARLDITISPDDERALARGAGRWLLRLAARGVTVQMRPEPAS